MSGMFLYFSCLDEAHRIAQDISAPEGSYWHAIMHRQEPDPGNSAYWFRSVGRHAAAVLNQERRVGVVVDHVLGGGRGERVNGREAKAGRVRVGNGEMR